MDYEDLLEELLPPWAVGLATSYTDLGAQLCTRDGRRHGNATLVSTPLSRHGHTCYLVLTDAGTEMYMSGQEIEEGFYPPKYIMNIATCPGACQPKSDETGLHAAP